MLPRHVKGGGEERHGGGCSWGDPVLPRCVCVPSALCASERGGAWVPALCVLSVNHTMGPSGLTVQSHGTGRMWLLTTPSARSLWAPQWDLYQQRQLGGTSKSLFFCSQMTVPLFSPDNPISFPRRAQVTNTLSCGRTEVREIDHTVTASHCVNPTQGVLMTAHRLAARVCASFVIASVRATRTGEAPPLQTLPTPPPVDAHLR